MIKRPWLRGLLACSMVGVSVFLLVGCHSSEESDNKPVPPLPPGVSASKPAPMPGSTVGGSNTQGGSASKPSPD